MYSYNPSVTRIDTSLEKSKGNGKEHIYLVFHQNTYIFLRLGFAGACACKLQTVLGFMGITPLEGSYIDAEKQIS